MKTDFGKLAPGHVRHTFEHAGRERVYLLYAPPNLDPRTPAPLLLMLHGAGGTAEISARSTGWSDKAAAAGFRVVYPQATRPDPDRPASFLRNPPMWSSGSGHSAADMGRVDDIAFISALLDRIVAEHSVDANRVYVAGFSNGASIAFLLAARLSSRIAAIASVAGKLWRKDITLERPLSLIYITGEADPLNPIAGGPVQSPWGGVIEHPPLSLAVETWSRLIGCEPTPTESIDTASGRVERYGPTPSGDEIEVWTIPGTGHVWPGGRPVLNERITGPSTDRMNANDVIWNFFQLHARRA